MEAVTNGRRWAASAVIAGILAVAACGGDPAADLETLQPASPPAGAEESEPEAPSPPPDSEDARPQPAPPPSAAVAPPPEGSPPEPAPAVPPPEPEGAPPPEAPPVEPEAPPADPEGPPADPAMPPLEPWAAAIDAGTAWREVFDAVSVAEQSCIRDALGDDVDSLLAEPLMAEGDTEEWTASIFGCLTPDNARSLFLAAMVASLREELPMEELSGEEMSCLRDLVAGLDIAALVSADAAGGDAEFVGETVALIACLPDVFLAAMFSDLGVGLEDLSEDELSCVREWVSATDWAALMGSQNDDEALEALEGLFDLVGCVPDLFDLPDPAAAGPDDHADSIAEATPVTVGEPVHGGLGHPDDFDVFTFEAVAGESYRIEVELGSLEDSVLTLYDADGSELAFNDDAAGTLASLIIWTAPESGNYYVEVASFDFFTTGSYTLSVELAEPDDHADSADGATPVPVDGSVQGAIDYFGDVDFFVFDAAAGESYRIEVALGSLEDSVASLYDADGWELAFNDDDGDSLASLIDWTAPGSGSHYVEVAALGASGTGSYTLSVTAR